MRKDGKKIAPSCEKELGSYARDRNEASQSMKAPGRVKARNRWGERTLIAADSLLLNYREDVPVCGLEGEEHFARKQMLITK